ncbi:7008_t:CDS:2 [Paraglomus brasilianum]|uniref:7008_t:CDS:1 n=1 Tax=Paraglomus brasilianum TaxID=144538 RepID=A0A9N8YXA2_9GLOM|nr:7008_t:CDS:2 [Paraglomus brasilianum]
MPPKTAELLLKYSNNCCGKAERSVMFAGCLEGVEAQHLDEWFGHLHFTTSKEAASFYYQMKDNPKDGPFSHVRFVATKYFSTGITDGVVSDKNEHKEDEEKKRKLNMLDEKKEKSQQDVLGQRNLRNSDLILVLSH